MIGRYLKEIPATVTLIIVTVVKLTILDFVILASLPK
jgi:hypothetical protein